MLDPQSLLSVVGKTWESSAQPYTSFCIQFLDKENNGGNDRLIAFGTTALFYNRSRFLRKYFQNKSIDIALFNRARHELSRRKSYCKNKLEKWKWGEAVWDATQIILHLKRGVMNIDFPVFWECLAMEKWCEIIALVSHSIEKYTKQFHQMISLNNFNTWFRQIISIIWKVPFWRRSLFDLVPPTLVLYYL